MNCLKFNNLLIWRMRITKALKRFNNPSIRFVFGSRGGWIWESRDRQNFPLYMPLDLLQNVFSMGNLISVSDHDGFECRRKKQR